MSFYIRINAPTTLRSADDGTTQMYINGAAGTAVYGTDATDAQLCDNSTKGLGCELRMDAVLVKPSPPTYAFFSQSRGANKWLSYSPYNTTLTFADTVGPNESFTVELQNPQKRERTIFNPHHGMYLSACDHGGACCIVGSATPTEQCYFVLESAVGTGPLMDGKRYFVKTIFGTQLRPTKTSLVQTTEDGEQDEFLVEAATTTGKRFYRFKTSTGKYVSVDESRDIVLVDKIPAVEEEKLDSTQFFLIPSPFIIGNYKIMNRANFMCLRADVDSTAMTTATNMGDLTRDTFNVEEVPTGVRARRGVRRAVHLFECPRDYPSVRGNDYQIACGRPVAPKDKGDDQLDGNHSIFTRRWPTVVAAAVCFAAAFGALQTMLGREAAHSAAVDVFDLGNSSGAPSGTTTATPSPYLPTPPPASKGPVTASTATTRPSSRAPF